MSRIQNRKEVIRNEKLFQKTERTKEKEGEKEKNGAKEGRE